MFSGASFTVLRKPLPSLLGDLYASSGILVRCSRALCVWLAACFYRRMSVKVAFFCVNALAHCSTAWSHDLMASHLEKNSLRPAAAERYKI